MFVVFKQLNGENIVVNTDLIATAVAAGDGVALTLQNGNRVPVAGSLSEALSKLTEADPR